MLSFWREFRETKAALSQALQLVTEMKASHADLMAANEALIRAGRAALDSSRVSLQDRDLALAANIEMSRGFERVAQAKTLREAHAVAREILSGVGL